MARVRIGVDEAMYGERPVETQTLAQPHSEDTLHRKLFSPGQVLVAAALGSAAGGTLLLAMNDRRLGNPRRGKVVLLVGMVATATLLALGFAGLLRSDVNGGSVGAVIGCFWYAKAVQGPVLASHLAAGGQRESWWKAIAFALVVAVAILAVAAINVMQ